jgi:high-affinity iron transporter
MITNLIRKAAATMLQILVITLRESIEAFLIVAITIAYLRKTGRTALLAPAYWGTATAIVLSIVLGVALAEVAVQPIWEGILAAIAAALVFGMVVYMLRAAKHLRTTINANLEQAAQKTGTGAALGVFGFVLLMITREGMETAFIVNALALKTQSMEMLAGASVGIGFAALVAWAWTRYGQRVRLDLFFQVTSIFLLLFVVQLLIYSFHELSEANILPIDNEYWHELTEPYGPEGFYGQWLSAGLVLVPLAWLAWSWMKTRGNRAAAA